MKLLLLSAHLMNARTYEDLTRLLLGRTGHQVFLAAFRASRCMHCRPYACRDRPKYTGWLFACVSHVYSMQHAGHGRV